MSTHNKEAAERERFEAWVRSRGGSVVKRDGRYIESMTRLWEECWFAALTASEAPAIKESLTTEQAPPLPEPSPTHYRERGMLLERMEMFTADQVLEHREQYAAWKIAALRSDQAPAGEVPSERERFEKWANSSWWAGVSFQRLFNDEYRNPGLESDWKVWQACAAISTPPAVPPKGWREFIEECATFAGKMVNGNRLSMQAKSLISAAPAAPQGEQSK